MPRKAADPSSQGLSSLLSKYSAERPDELVSTNIPTIDNLIGGGIARGALYALWGAQGSGKSTIAMQIMKSFLKNGERCVFIDVEKAFNTCQQESFGLREYVEEGLLLHLKADTYVQADEITSAIARDKEMDVKLVVIDSETMLLPKFGDDQSVADQMPGQKARQASLWLTKMKGQFYDAGISCIVINHARANIDMGGNPYAPKDKMAGGYAMKHVPDCIIAVSAGQKIGERECPVGQVIHITTDKNKFAPPFQKVDSKLFFGVGIKKNVDLIDRCIDMGIITQSGAFYTFEDETVRGQEALYSMSQERVNKLESLYMDIVKSKRLA